MNHWTHWVGKQGAFITFQWIYQPLYISDINRTTSWESSSVGVSQSDHSTHPSTPQYHPITPMHHISVNISTALHHFNSDKCITVLFERFSNQCSVQWLWVNYSASKHVGDTMRMLRTFLSFTRSSMRLNSMRGSRCGITFMMMMMILTGYDLYYMMLMIIFDRLQSGERMEDDQNQWTRYIQESIYSPIMLQILS